MNCYPVVKKALFKLNPNWAHNVIIRLGHRYPNLITSFFPTRSKDLSNYTDRYDLMIGENLWTFPVGLAAGLDKNANAIEFLSRFYFGALEVGSVGIGGKNKLDLGPSLFTIPEKESLRNMHDYSSDGVLELKNNLLQVKKSMPIGISLIHDKKTKIDEIPGELKKLYNSLVDVGDYFVLQDSVKIENLISTLQEIVITKPIYLKISPHLSHKEILEFINVVVDYRLAGMIATGPTIKHPYGNGWVSGTYLRANSRSIQSFILDVLKADRSIELIGCGGFSRFADLWRFWKEGGRAIQIFTSFVYQGPGLLHNIKLEIDKLLDYYHINTLQELLNNMNDLQYPLNNKMPLP